jgi:predicted transcriptional regulator of viral defense system
MAEQLRPMFAPNVQRTRLAEAVLAEIEQDRCAVVTAYAMFQVLRVILATGDKQRLFLRPNVFPVEYLRRVTKNLLDSRGIETDSDYGRSVYRVVSIGESTAEEVCALANPFGYISHLSAMQRWGLTERRPEALYLSMPPAGAAGPLIEERMKADYGQPFADFRRGEAVKLHFIRHPSVVRGRKLSVYNTKRLGRWVQVGGEHARLATNGQTFLDMLEAPQHCGGMAHVLDVWQRHARAFTEEIIDTVDEFGEPIHKVRAGYIFDEVLRLGEDRRVQDWIKFAQRGSSRVLDPSKGFSSTYSEKWMLSTNVAAPAKLPRNVA